MRNILIVFSGKAQSGKTSSCQLLKEVIGTRLKGIFYGQLVEIHSFASSLKEIAVKYFFWNGSKENIMRPVSGMDISEEPIPDMGRQLLINIGKSFRDIRPTIWVDYTINTIKNVDKEKPHGVIFLNDDMRYKNELVLAKSFHSCVSVRITRKEGALDLDDLSETDLDDAEFDFYISNDGTKEELKEKMEKLLNDIEERYSDPSYKFQNVKFGENKAAELESQLKNLKWES